MPDDPSPDEPTPGAEQATRLADAVTKLVDYYAAEYQMPLATAIGVLQIKIHSLIHDAIEAEDE